MTRSPTVNIPATHTTLIPHLHFQYSDKLKAAPTTEYVVASETHESEQAGSDDETLASVEDCECVLLSQCDTLNLSQNIVESLLFWFLVVEVLQTNTHTLTHMHIVCECESCVSTQTISTTLQLQFRRHTLIVS